MACVLMAIGTKVSEGGLFTAGPGKVSLLKEGDVCHIAGVFCPFSSSLTSQSAYDFDHEVSEIRDRLLHTLHTTQPKMSRLHSIKYFRQRHNATITTTYVTNSETDH